jgi:hypothetical protein
VDVLKILLKPSVFVRFVAACSAPAHDGQAGMYVPCSIFFTHHGIKQIGVEWMPETDCKLSLPCKMIFPSNVLAHNFQIH